MKIWHIVTYDATMTFLTEDLAKTYALGLHEDSYLLCSSDLDSVDAEKVETLLKGPTAGPSCADKEDE